MKKMSPSQLRQLQLKAFLQTVATHRMLEAMGNCKLARISCQSSLEMSPSLTVMKINLTYAAFCWGPSVTE